MMISLCGKELIGIVKGEGREKEGEGWTWMERVRKGRRGTI